MASLKKDEDVDNSLDDEFLRHLSLPSGVALPPDSSKMNTAATATTTTAANNNNEAIEDSGWLAFRVICRLIRLIGLACCVIDLVVVYVVWMMRSA